MKIIWNVVKLDFLCIKKYFKLYVYLLCVASAFAFFSKNIIMSTITMIMLISVRGVSLIYEVQDKYNSDKLYNYLPLNRVQIVAGRYISTSLVGLFVLIIFLILQSILFAFLGQTTSGGEIILSFALGCLLLYSSILIQIPIFYGLGAISAKPFCFLPIIFYSTLIYILNETVWYREMNKALFCLLVGGVVIVLLVLSISISLKIYKRKEF